MTFARSVFEAMLLTYFFVQFCACVGPQGLHQVSFGDPEGPN